MHQYILNRKHQAYNLMYRNQIDLSLDFMEGVDNLIQANISNDTFCVKGMHEQLAVSYSNLYRKIKNHSGRTPSVYIRIQRLEFSKKLLTETKLNITDIAYRSGFNNLPYYSKCFTDYFGYSPSSFRNQ